MRIDKLVRIGLLATLLGGGSVGCGSLDIPIDMALVGDNTITIQPPSGPALATDVVGGVEATVSVNLSLFNLLNPNGIVAGITIDDILFAGKNIPILPGILKTGVLCIEQDPSDPGGGNAHLRLLQSQADFMFALNTTIRGTDPDFLDFLDFAGIDPLFPFQAVVEAQDVPLSLTDLLALVSGTGSGGLELSQEIVTSLPPEIPFLGGSEVTALLTLATVDEIPAFPRLERCVEP